MSKPLDVDLETVGLLLSLLAHDLRNPLSALHSNIGFIGSVGGSQDEDVKDALFDGMVSCDGLAHIIDNLDLVGQSLRDTRYPPPLQLSAAAFARDVVSRCLRVADSHGLRLEFDAEAADPLIEAFASRELLARALGNLIRNSIQHSPANSLVEVRLAGPTSALGSGSGQVEFIVCDQGTPIDPELWEFVFTSEGQVSARGKGDGRYSRGLGLLSARLAASISGAKVSVIPACAGFTNTFCLSVPAFHG